MNKKIYALLGLLLCVTYSMTAISQDIKPSKVIKASYFDVSKKLKDVKPTPYGMRDRSWKYRVIPNQLELGVTETGNEEWNGVDPVLQSVVSGSRGEPMINVNFPGVSNNYGVAPPDTQGDVGPNHYFQMVNLGFAIWDKEGNLLYGPADNISLWDGFPGPWSNTNDGDPIVLYDEYADRWLASQFSLPNYPNGPFYELVAVSATGDPTGEWYRYAFEFDEMPDYPKFGVWPDGYYFTVNQFNGGFTGGGVSVLDRDAMIAGDPDAQMIFFDLGTSYWSLLPADADGAMMPAEGSPCYYLSMTQNALRLYQSEIDWDNVNNSTLSYVKSIQTQPFSNQGLSIGQPGTGQKLGTLADRLMYRVQYRNFGEYEVMVTNHTVNAQAGRAGVRWYELRNYGEGWEMYQQGTYAPEDGLNRWMGSVAMNQNGDIAIGYSVSSSTTYPSIRFAGQSSSNSGTGEMDIPETNVYDGTTSQTGIERWGDYSMTSVDPSDGQTFWFTTEYSNGGWNWATQVVSFSFTQVPEAEFEVNENLIPTGESVDFTDMTSGIPSSWEWFFEGAEPNTSTDQDPVGITYSQEGSFSVTLIATNELGSDTIVKENYITVSSSLLPEVDFSASKQIICSLDTVNLIDQTMYMPVQWLWEFEPATVSFVNGTDETSQNPEVIFDESTAYTVTLTAWNLNGSSSLTQTEFISAGGIAPYFLETFADLDFVNEYWQVINPDNSNTWELYSVGGTGNDSIAAGVDFSKYFAIGQRDRLVSPAFNLVGLSAASMEFQYAYAQRMDQISDSLLVYISTDCGLNWTKIYQGGEDGGGSFATHPPVPDGSFWPMEVSDWCMSGWGGSCVTIDLAPWTGNSNVLFAFETWSGYGNPLFIDNFAVSQTVGMNDGKNLQDQFTIYPNPSTGVFSLIFPSDESYNQLQVINQLGQIVFQSEIPEGQKSMEINLDYTNLAGVYTVKLIGNESSVSKKLIKY